MILLYTVFVLQIIWGCNGCFPIRTKGLTNSYIPVAIQILHHYKNQLQEYLPYTYTAVCGFEKRDLMSPPPILSTDICVDESLRRINLFLIDLQREAVNQNLADFQGYSRQVLAELAKTSYLSSIQQLHFILKKLQTENAGNTALKCKIQQFLSDLRNKNSKLYRNLLKIKPLSYLY